MAIIWYQDRSLDWAVFPLAQPAYWLSQEGDPILRPRQDDSVCAGALLLARVGPVSVNADWLLVGPPDVAAHVNGRQPAGGLRLLRDHDELRIGSGRRLFFSREQLARVEPLPDFGRPIHCARCKLEIQPGTPAVCCPRCGTWTHSSEESPCWTYGPTCPLCEQSTDPEAGYSWTPAQLGA